MKIITVFENGDEICEISEGISAGGAEGICCSIGDVENVINSFMVDAVFSVGFFKEIAGLCFGKRITYISWVLTSPAPEVFTPEIMYETNRVYIADAGLHKILKKSGISTVYGRSAGFYDIRSLRNFMQSKYRPFDAEGIRENMGFLLDEDENKYLQGLEKAQELCHTQNVFFHGLSPGIIDKIFDGLQAESIKDPVYKRYFVSECILRRIVKERERKRAGISTDPDKKVVCFDDTGVESLSAMLCGKTVFSDGCGLSGTLLKRGEDYVYYEDRAELFYKLNYEILSPASDRAKLSSFTVKNVVREMIFS